MRPEPKTVAAGLLLVSFAVGSLTGMALEETLGIDWFEFLDEDVDEVEDRLLVGLDLSREQRQRTEEILEREEDRLEAYWESRLPEITAIRHESYAEIRALLDADQRARFDERLQELGAAAREEGGS